MRTALPLGIVTLFLFLSPACLASEAPPAEQEIAKLVEQLGDNEYSVRLAASEKLKLIGKSAEPQLKDAQKSTDLEVRLRAERILKFLSEMSDADLKREVRLKEFVDDLDGKKGIHLPAWIKCQTLIGNDLEARKLFVEMQRGEHALLEAYEKNNEHLARAFEESCERNKPVFNSAKPTHWVGSLAALLLVAGDSQARVPAKSRAQLAEKINYSEIVAVYNENALLKNLVSQWIGEDADAESNNNMAKFLVAIECKLDEQAIDMAVRKLRQLSDQKDKAPPGFRMEFYYLASLAKLGDRTHITVVEPFLEDESQFGENFQLRDLALFTLAKLSGEPLETFGLKEPEPADTDNPLGMLFSLTQNGFKDAKEREAAIGKWREWAQANLKPETSPAAP